MMVAIQRLTTDKLSWFRTHHTFEHYGEIHETADFCKYLELAKSNNLQVRVIGNGSNCLFRNDHIKTLVLKNKLAKSLDWQDANSVRVSSSTPVMAILKACRDRNLDSFYYLASVPATVGGAVCMNAGRGKKHNATVFDYLQSVDYATHDGVHTMGVDQIRSNYRWTEFLAHPDRFICSATFRFPSTAFASDPILERIKFSQAMQDNTGPNCGTVFCQSSSLIMKCARGLRWRGACYSQKTTNWILNRSRQSASICSLIRIVRFAHRAFGLPCRLELTEID